LKEEQSVDLLVIGGGAAGFFGAIQFAELNPGASVMLIEKSNKVLSKVKVSGGGRCNVTNQCQNPFELARHYPRGEKSLKFLFKIFNVSDMVAWLDARRVLLHTEADGRMFPITNSSQTIIDCFLSEFERLNIEMRLGDGVSSVFRSESNIHVVTETAKIYNTRSVLIAIGGSSKNEFYDIVRKAGNKVKSPIPSLFTFNDPAKSFSDLMGLSVNQAEVRIEGTKFKEVGPVLITHWGLSGPAVIKLSAWAAQYLFEQNYQFKILINWTGNKVEGDIKKFFEDQKKNKGKQKILSNPQFSIPSRLWERLCERSEIPDDKIWSEVSNKQLNKLLENLIRCGIPIEGKTTFKEEFVTCGGVVLNEVDLDTMQSKNFPGMFFAGEILDIDGETGGFNFQAAWTTAYVAAKGISEYLKDS
jgi:predicted Rossmann fold flavoprotein